MKGARSGSAHDRDARGDARAWLRWQSVTHETSTAVRVRGVVDLRMGGVRCDDGTWDLQFTLAAWRIEDGPLVRSPLLLFYNRQNRDALEAAFTQVPENSIVVVRCARIKPFDGEGAGHSARHRPFRAQRSP